MKFARWLLISLGILVVLTGALFALALQPSVQRWAMLRATADMPGLKFDVAQVSAGFSRVMLKVGQHGWKTKFALINTAKKHASA